MRANYFRILTLFGGLFVASLCAELPQPKSIFMPIGTPENPNIETPDLGNIGHYVTVEYFLGTPLQFRNESFFLPNTMTSYFTVNSIDCE